MKLPQVFLTLILVAIASTTAIAQNNAVRAGSPEFYRMLDQHRMRATAEREIKGRYYDELTAFWQAEKFDTEKNAETEYARLCSKFQKKLVETRTKQLDEAEQKLFAYRRGRIRRNQEKPIEETESRVYFKHGDTKDKAVENQEKQFELLEKELDAMKKSNSISHLPLSWASMPQGSIFYSDDPVVVVQVVDKSNVLMMKRLPDGSVRHFWVADIPTAGMTDDTPEPLAGVFLVDGTKTYNTAAGTNTVNVLRRLPIDSSKYHKLW